MIGELDSVLKDRLINSTIKDNLRGSNLWLKNMNSRDHLHRNGCKCKKSGSIQEQWSA